VKNGCRARNARPLQGSRASRAKVSSTEETLAFHEAGCASRSWSVANESPRNSARAARSRRQAPEAVRDAHRREDNARQRPVTDRPKHARRRESPSDLARAPQGARLQEPHDTQAARTSRDGHTLVVRISSPALLNETREVATPLVDGRTTMAPHALALHALHGPEWGRDVRS